MSERRRTDTELLSVSIVAGPAADALLGPSAPSILEQSAGSSPEEIIERIRRVADRREIDKLIIQCESERPVMAYASLFAVNNPGTSALAQVARVTATTYAIKTSTFLDSILSRASDSIPACFMAEQMEFVDQIVFDEDSPDFDLARSIAIALNPGARVFRLNEAAGKWNQEPAQTPFEFNASLQRAGWRRLVDDEEATVGANEQVTAMGYSARRPFHPGRFWNFLQQKSQAVFRAKGFFWLASRMDEVGGLNLAGTDLHCSSAGNWWATRDVHSREIEMPEHAKKLWEEPFGDRRQTFGIMALDMDRKTLHAALDACLLSDTEMSDGPEAWRDLPDPFPSWSHHHAHAHHHHEHEEGCAHHHHDDSAEHHCCR